MTTAAFFLRLRLAEASVLIAECEELIERNVNAELQVLANEGLTR